MPLRSNTAVVKGGCPDPEVTALDAPERVHGYDDKVQPDADGLPGAAQEPHQAKFSLTI